MNKKILIGSIIAVAILVLVSFTSVIGYRSAESNVKESPLFNIRCSRARNEESKDLSCNYIGKGVVTNIYLPKGNDRTDSVDALINVIKRMDDKSLRRFAYLITYRLLQTDSTPDFDSKDIFQSLKQLRDNPDSVVPYTEKETEETFWLTCTCPSIGKGHPLDCLIFTLLMIPIMIILFILDIPLMIYTILYDCS